MFTQEGEGGVQYTVTSQRGVKIKVRKGVARSPCETNRKYIQYNKKMYFWETKSNSNIRWWWGNKKDNKNRQLLFYLFGCLALHKCMNGHKNIMSLV